MKGLYAVLLSAVVTATAYGYSFQGLSYSNSDTVKTGVWTCRYNLAKSLASSKNIPMVVVWVSPTCTYCKNFVSALAESSKLKTWTGKRNYMLVIAIGESGSDTYGTTTADVSDAYSFAEVGLYKFPFVGLWWKKNASGSEVKKRFTGRSGYMPSSSGGLAQQFMDSVDQYFDGYSGASASGGSPVPPSNPTTPGVKSYTVTFNANGGSVSDKTRTVESGKGVGTLPTPTRSGYRFDGWYSSSKGGTKITSSTVVTGNVTYYAHWIRQYSLSVTISPSGGGRVSGTGSYVSGEEATLKATATSGYVLAGWYSSSTLLTQEPSYAYVMGSSAKTLTAKFIKKSADTVVIGFSPAEEYVTAAEISPIAISAKGGSLPTVKVTSLPSGLKFTAKAITGHAANTIYGTPKKSGVYSVQVKATTAGGAAASAVMKLTVRAANERLVSVECDPEGGKVSGGGIFADGKKASVRATAASNRSFAGWFVDGVLVSQSSSYSYPVSGHDVTLSARFVTKDEDLESIEMRQGATTLDETAVVTNLIRCGVSTNWTIVAHALTAVTVSASGLPSGLKLVKTPVDKDRKEYAYTIAGVPTAPSKADAKTGFPKATVAKLTVATAGKNTVVCRIAYVIEALPPWAYGTFDGFAAADENGKGVGVATMTVSSAGKISGKFALEGTNWTYSANGYTNFTASATGTRTTFRIEGVAKYSRLTRPFALEVTPGVENCSLVEGEGDGLVVTMHRNVWKDKPALPSPKRAKTELEAPEGFAKLAVSVTSAGKATFAGKLEDGTSVSSASTVFVDSDGVRKVYLVVPFSRKFEGFLDLVGME